MESLAHTCISYQTVGVIRLKMPAIRLAILTGLLALLPLALATGCVHFFEDDASSSMTPHEIFQRMEQSMTKEDHVFHANVETVTSFENETRPIGTIEAWLDVERQMGR